jgi:magnesium transporter
MVFEEHRDNLIEVIRSLVGEERVAEAIAILSARHAADQADLLEDMEDEEIVELLKGMSSEHAATVLEYLDEDVRRRVLAEISPAALAPIIDEADEDVAADIVQDLSPEQAEQVLPLLEDRSEIDELLIHNEESAGGVMSPDVVTVHEEWTVERTIDYLRRLQPDSSQAYYLYAIDEADRFMGVVSFRDLIVSHPETRIDAIMSTEVFSVPAGSDRETAAEIMRHYNLLALPVVDEEQRILGVITADDVLDIQVAEATEDFLKMAGVGVKEWAFSPVLESAQRRIPWLAFNMIWAFAGAAIISVFQGTIERAAAVAIFMPMIAGQAGNAGIQTATIVVRSMALGELKVADSLRVLRKEWALGLIKGTVFGTVLGLIAWLWQGNATLGLVAGLAMFLNMLVASTGGVLVPMTLRRVGIDPATIAGVFDTMVTDFMGFLIFLSLATLLISRIAS